MKIQESNGKKLLHQYGIPTSRGEGFTQASQGQPSTSMLEPGQ